VCVAIKKFFELVRFSTEVIELTCAESQSDHMMAENENDWFGLRRNSFGDVAPSRGKHSLRAKGGGGHIQAIRAKDTHLCAGHLTINRALNSNFGYITFTLVF